MKLINNVNFFLFFISLGFSLELGEDEILSAQTNKIEFQSWQGKITNRNPKKIIIDIGKRITREMKKNKKSGGKKNRYYVKRFLPENNKLGADIISLGKGANINHIVNLIRVVQGYIEVNFSYSPKKAKAVSYFILIYNAVNRNNFDYIKNNFTEGTIQYLEKYKYVGIDTHYKNWRGKTSLVIPLIFDGDLEASEVAKVSQDRVRKEKNNLKERKIMVDVRKESLENKQENVIEESKKLQQQEKELIKIQKKINQLKQIIKEREDALQETDNLATKKTLKAEIESLVNENKDKIQKLKEKQKALEESKEQLENKVIAIADEQASIEQEKENLQDHILITEAKKNKEEFQQNLSQGKVFFLKTLGKEGLHFNQSLYIINPVDNSVEISTVSNICGRYINFLNGDPLLIIYNDPEKTDLHLARFSRNNLQITYKSEIVVLNNSPIWVFENFVYVVGLKRDAFLYKLNRKMQSIAKSSVPIYPDTQVTFTRNQIYCTVLDGNQNYKIVVLKAENLEKIVEIE